MSDLAEVAAIIGSQHVDERADDFLSIRRPYAAGRITLAKVSNSNEVVMRSGEGVARFTNLPDFVIAAAVLRIMEEGDQ